MNTKKLGGTARSKSLKTKISESFKELEKYGYKVWNFNSNLKMRCKYWVDLVVAGKGWLFLIEVKIGTDKLSDGQEITRHELSHIKGNCKYEIVTENNYLEVRGKILGGDYEHI